MSKEFFKPAWKQGDPKYENDAIAFWAKHRLLPNSVDAKKRVKELCGIVYRENSVIAVSTAAIEDMPRFRCRMAIYRCSAAPSVRRQPFSLKVTVESRDLLEKWSLNNPAEGVMAMAARIESSVLVRHMPSVFWPADLVFMGYTPKGRQLRVSWFKHATVNQSAKTRLHGFGQVPQTRQSEQ
jgi:hypothetical protein